MQCLNTILDFDQKDYSINATYVTHTLPEDLLVLSCTLYRLTTDQGGKYRGYSLTTNATEIGKNITHEDRKLAEEIRIDFRKKLSYFALVVGPLSKFKTSLNEFLNADFKQSDGTYRVSDKYAGMAYRLPYFHAYNMQQQSLFDMTNSSIKLDTYVTDSVKITFLKKLDSKRSKTKDKIEYWFEDSTHQRIMLPLSRDNPLLPLLDKYSTSPLVISGHFRKRSNYAVEYYVASKWKIVDV